MGSMLRHLLIGMLASGCLFGCDQGETVYVSGKDRYYYTEENKPAGANTYSKVQAERAGYTPWPGPQAVAKPALPPAAFKPSRKPAQPAAVSQAAAPMPQQKVKIAKPTQRQLYAVADRLAMMNRQAGDTKTSLSDAKVEFRRCLRITQKGIPQANYAMAGDALIQYWQGQGSGQAFVDVARAINLGTAEKYRGMRVQALGK